ncbi:hypothetical protein [Stratiformator vulcanicus]|nr:hypothetical protein [Stratiformator vulcanicus]
MAIAEVPEDWQKHDAGGKFSFHAPPDLKEQPVQGIDSFVGRYNGKEMTLSFDYGWYSNALDGEGYEGKWTKIDGRRAWIAAKGETIGVHFPKVEGMIRLTMFVQRTGADADTVKTIFKSIRFGEQADAE